MAVITKRVWYVDGITPYTMRRILRYAFNGYFFKLQLDQESREFKIWMLNKVNDEKLDTDDLKYFKDFFYGCNFIIINPEESEII